MDHPHILTHYDESLDHAVAQVVTLGRNVSSSLEDIGKLVTQGDHEWAGQVEGALDSLRAEAAAALQACHDILGRFYPVASDLRLVISLLKSCERLEEAIELLGTLAATGREIVASGQTGCNLSILVSMAFDILDSAMLSLERKDRHLAKTVKKQDKLLDRYHKELIEQIIIDGETRGLIPVDVDRIFFIRAAERIGDTGKGVARAVISLYPRNKSVK